MDSSPDIVPSALPGPLRSPVFFFSQPTSTDADADASAASDPMSASTSSDSCSVAGAASGSGSGSNSPRTRIHFRTTDMHEIEGRSNPNQVWICSKKPRSPLPGYVSPAAESTNHTCYFTTSGQSDAGHLHDGTALAPADSPDCLHLGLRPKFVHSETVPDFEALQEGRAKSQLRQERHWRKSSGQHRAHEASTSMMQENSASHESSTTSPVEGKSTFTSHNQ